MARLQTAISRLLSFHARYGNPWVVAFHRLMQDRKPLLVIDRATGVGCVCHPAARRMFGEVWHDHDYDVPHLPLGPGDVVVDIGANQGFYTCYAALNKARVHAFEPAPDNYRLLEANVRRNGFGGLVTMHPWAVGARAGTVELMVSDALGGGMNTISPEFAHGSGISVRARLAVPCVTLDEVVRQFQLDRIRICKLDCEGSELEILTQAAPATVRAIDAFVVEYHQEAYPVADLVKLMLSWGSHQVSFAEDKWCERQIIRAVANRVLSPA